MNCEGLLRLYAPLFLSGMLKCRAALHATCVCMPSRTSPAWLCLSACAGCSPKQRLIWCWPWEAQYFEVHALQPDLADLARLAAHSQYVKSLLSSALAPAALWLPQVRRPTTAAAPWLGLWQT